MGDGVDFDTRTLKSECIKGDLVYSGKRKIDLRFERIRDLKRLRTILGLEVGAEISLEILKATGATKFYLDSQNNYIRENFVYSFGIGGVYARLKNVHVPEEIKLLADNKNRCGTHFIHGVELGANLLVNVSFDFSDSSLKTKFNSEVDVELLELFEGYGQGNVDYDQYKGMIKITVSAHQVGGINSNVASVLATENGDSFISCDISNLEPCKKALRSIIRFASTTFIDDIGTLSYNPKAASTAAIIDHHLSSYHQMGLYDIAPNSPELIEEYLRYKRQELMEDYLFYQGKLTQVRRILQSYLTKEEKELFQKIEQTVKNNVYQIVATAKTCYSRPELCSDLINTLNIVPINDGLLKREPKIYDRCMQDSFNKQDQLVLNSIYRKLGISGIDDCNRLQQVFDHLEVLDLRDQGINNASLLKYLPKLQVLDLSNNYLIDCNWLPSLKHLRSLNLSSNQIQYLPTDFPLENIRYLDLGGNNLVHIDPIIQKVTKNSKLKKLSLAGNPILPNSVYGIEDKFPSQLERQKSLFITMDDICEKWRKHALNNKQIDHYFYKIMKDREHFPHFRNWSNTRLGEIAGTSSCKSKTWENLLLNSIRITQY